MKRHPAISSQGHVEAASSVPSFVACRNCHYVRLKTNPWRRPCPAAEDRHATPLVVDTRQVHVVREGLYRGVTKKGG